MNYACPYCGRDYGPAPDPHPNAIACCGEVGHLEQVAAMPAANADTFQQVLRRCRVKVGGTTYTALTPNTFDALDGALARHPGAGRIEVGAAA
jgi:hypothetical protein